MTSLMGQSGRCAHESRVHTRRSPGTPLHVALIGLAFILPGPSRCLAQTLTLGQTPVSDDLGIFEASGQFTNSGAMAIDSNFGLGSGANFKNNGSTSYGNKYTSVSTSSLASASSLASSLAQNGILSNNTISGSSSIVVYDLTSITQTLTIQGNSSQAFIINVNQGISLNGSSSIKLSGGVTANHVLFNVGGAIATNGSNTLNGTFLDLNNAITLNGSTLVNGALVGGDGITNNGSASVDAQIFVGEIITAPELPTSAMAGLAVLLVLAKAGFDRLRRRGTGGSSSAVLR